MIHIFRYPQKIRKLVQTTLHTSVARGTARRFAPVRHAHVKLPSREIQSIKNKMGVSTPRRRCPRPCPATRRHDSNRTSPTARCCTFSLCVFLAGWCANVSGASTSHSPSLVVTDVTADGLADVVVGWSPHSFAVISTVDATRMETVYVGDCDGVSTVAVQTNPGGCAPGRDCSHSRPRDVAAGK